MSPLREVKNQTSKSHYLRFLKRRQWTSLLLERTAYGAVIAALVLCIYSLNESQHVRAQGVLFVALGCALLALICIGIEAYAASREKRLRQKEAQKSDDTPS